MTWQTLLFDIDGVLLSEERYFDATALTVWELIHSNLYLGQQAASFSVDLEEAQIRHIRKEVFHDDTVLSFMKSRGINSNWDMVYLAFSYQLILLLEQLHQKDPAFVEQLLQKEITYESLKEAQEKSNDLSVSFQPNYAQFIDDFKESTEEKQALFLYLNTICQKRLSVSTTVFKRQSTLWDVCQETFQEWYLGDRYVEPSVLGKPKESGKKGFLQDEIPIISREQMIELFSTLKEKGYQLGIGTGRPEIETLEPLKALGVLSFFDENRILTATDVLHAERQYPEHAPLAKPQPYAYVQGMLGKETPVMTAITYPLPIENKEQVLVIGDSLADYMAAKTMGCQFAAVLTGLSGKDARPDFENRADFILDNVFDLLTIIK